MIFVNWFLFLVTYSFFGWVYESAICSVAEKRLVNRGFLNGPYCPVYGVGALVSIMFMYGRSDNLFLLFFTGVVLTCTVEYLTSVLMEKLFNNKWWDYSGHRFHINGRVSLLGGVVFGMMSVLLITVIHPAVSAWVEGISFPARAAVSGAVLVLASVDMFVTVRHVLELNGRLQEIQAAINNYLADRVKRGEEFKHSLLSRFEESEFYNERIKALVRYSRTQNVRLARAFPKLRSVKYEEAWTKLKELLPRP